MPEETPTTEPATPQTFRHRLAQKLQTARLPVALVVSVLISLGFTVLSVWLYSASGTSRLDLSRPGFEHERSEVEQPETRTSYDTTSPVDAKAVDDFLQEYDTRSARLNGFSGFSDPSLMDDEGLQLVVPSGESAR